MLPPLVRRVQVRAVIIQIMIMLRIEVVEEVEVVKEVEAEGGEVRVSLVKLQENATMRGWGCLNSRKLSPSDIECTDTSQSQICL